MYWTFHLSGAPTSENHVAVVIGTSIFTIGGYCNDNCYGTIKPIDIHVFDTVKLKWWKLELNEDQEHRCVPSQRYGHTAVAQDSKIYLWGGRNDEEVSNILYCFDTDTRIWSTPNVFGYIPLPRDGHSACIINNCMYIFGGFQDGEFSQGLYMLNLHTMKWSLVITKGNEPSHRNFHTATVIGDRMYIYGGHGDKNAPRQNNEQINCPEMYYFDTITKMWMCPTVFGPKPPGRHSHSAFVHNGFLYIFGGFNYNLDLHFQDLNRYDPKNSSWVTIIPKGTPPNARKRHICQVINDRVFISGGSFPLNNKLLSLLNTSTLLYYYIPEEILSQFKKHDNLHVLDLNPSLKNICLVNLRKLIEKKKICAEDLCIPLSLKNDLVAVEPFENSAGINQISEPLKNIFSPSST